MWVEDGALSWWSVCGGVDGNVGGKGEVIVVRVSNVEVSPGLSGSDSRCVVVGYENVVDGALCVARSRPSVVGAGVADAARLGRGEIEAYGVVVKSLCCLSRLATGVAELSVGVDEFDGVM